MPLDIGASRSAFARIAESLNLDVDKASAAVMTIAEAKMVNAIQEITVNEGIDPRDATIVAGGGSCGLSIVGIANALGCHEILIPPTASVLSASGALLSDIVMEFTVSQFTSSNNFCFDRVNQALSKIHSQANAQCELLKLRGFRDFRKLFSCQARYPNQIWEQDVPLKAASLVSDAEVQKLVMTFHEIHERSLGFRDDSQEVEISTWKCRLVALTQKPSIESAAHAPSLAVETRKVYFPEVEWIEVPVYPISALQEDIPIGGPAIIADEFNTIVLRGAWQAASCPDGTIKLIRN
jgi:N-methylhydantoinase A